MNFTERKTIDEELKVLEKNVEQVKKASRKKIAQPPALLSINGQPLFRPYTINAIQGKEGSHKSVSASGICCNNIENLNTFDIHQAMSLYEKLLAGEKVKADKLKSRKPGVQ
ncbi:hypothetical protein SAMN05660909_05035 [Chitinophaga terrae (ex Kim and Jung 2007)]|uniref:Uncharacterized protein n=1 Tax=Chitinophaga terrae (ex Kim and Jung 2007) TaxID=408074 RepID=A0A1H4G8N3_9BACT|nr:hypothetical protein [Chitinophaga terrae (ex Kim and Jung 2007)]GEP93217.1 hypothetical protein CTE07_48620 [Chitinophaga terrae (ex Kim and Jung 2007)]SEB05807.1 hypothetical protein SAMN05660909_05035 [Chitinophaga terrae (ex Kim and Jung 2007)]